MTGILGDVGQVVSVVLLVLGVVAMYAAVLLLWRPLARMRGWKRAPWLLLVAGGVVIVIGTVGL